MSIGYMVTTPDLHTWEPLYYSRLGEVTLRRSRWGWIKTPNGQLVTCVEAHGRRLFVYTRSRVYYLRRNKLRLWRLL